MYYDNRIIVARWPAEGKLELNWGDRLNGELIQLITKTPVANATSVVGWDDRPVYRVIGSGLGRLRKNEIVWGLGFIRSDATLECPPYRVHAVRGPLSRRKLIEFGVDCPEVYGDPAILFPLFYFPNVEKRFDVGVIQHFREVDRIPLPNFRDSKTVKVIDIFSNIRKFVRDILSCRLIVSSSLHGIICAHAYGVQAVWLRASDLPIGDGFKFHDYYASIGIDAVRPCRINEDGTVDTEVQPLVASDQRIDAERLLQACPFIGAARKSELVSALRRGVRMGRTGTIYRQPGG